MQEGSCDILMKIFYISRSQSPWQQNLHQGLQKVTGKLMSYRKVTEFFDCHVIVKLNMTSRI